jgi:amino acid adenylation domain-containing protein
MRAGGAYVPLDPEYPEQRLSFMMADAGLTILLTQSHLLDSLPEDRPEIVITLDDAADLVVERVDNPLSVTNELNLAYCIYTSGSTGRPKGAMNTHAGICNRLQWMRSAYPLTTRDRVLQKTTFSFDVSIWEMFWPLITGARLVMARPGGHRDIAYLMSLIREQAITAMQFVPSMLQVFLEEEGVEACNSLKRVVCSGEALLFDLQQRFFARLPEVELYNLYGPTETAVGVSSWACNATSDSGVVPIGKPIANTEMYILDRQMNPVPVGVAGELYIGGVQLARGYLSKPELTARRFVPHPFAYDGGERLYRTGDLATFQADGSIRYLGRLDHQVKIRGYRIELGEIESALAAHQSIRDVSVIVREDIADDKRLVAYIVPRTSVSFDELRGYLHQLLPEFMIPAAFVVLDKLPLTPNGKLDRRALPAPEESGEDRKTEFVGPRDDLEVQLVRIWQEVLNVCPVSVRDNFFDRGGHSLLAVRLLSRIRRVLGIDLPLSIFFKQQPTIEQLAAHIRQQAEAEQQKYSPLVEMKRGTVGSPFFCIHPAGGNVLCYARLARHLGPNQSVYGLEAHGVHPEQSPLTSVEEMAASYITAIRAVQPIGPYQLGGWSMGGIVAYEMAQQLQAQREEVSLLALFDTWAPASVRALGEPDELSLMVLFAQDMGLSWQELEVSLEEMAKLNSQDQLAHVLELAIAAGVLPPDIEQSQMARFYRVFKINVRAVSNYIPRPLRGRVTLLKAEELLQGSGPGDDWEELALDGLEVHMVPGNHFTTIREPYVRALAQSLARCMANS